MAAITSPGVYDITAEEYLADPVEGGSLSCSGAKKLLPPSCPAKFKYELGNPAAQTPDMTFGKAAHRELLGKGSDIAVLDFDSRRTKAYREAEEEALAAGATPMLARDYATVRRMVDAVRAHDLAGPLLTADGGESEQVLVWQDEPTGVWLRAMLDRTVTDREGRLIIADYKTTDSLAPDAVARQVVNLNYHMQEWFYLEAVRRLGLNTDPVFLFVFQERTPPYLVGVRQLDFTLHLMGEQRSRRAIGIYKACTESGIWPGYGEGVDFIEAPRWAERQHSEEYIQP